MTVERIKELLGTAGSLKVRYKLRGIGNTYTEELCRPDFRNSTYLFLHTDNWASEYYKIRYEDITDIKPKGSKKWLR